MTDHQLTQTIEETARQLGINRNSAYGAARRGEIPTIRIGRRLLVPKAAFRRMLAATGEAEGSGGEGKHGEHVPAPEVSQS